MKKLLLVLSTIFTFQAFSQFVIENDDFGQLGDTVIYGVDSNYTDDLNNLTLIGDSLEWNFLDLNAAFEDTTLFEATSSFVDGNVFTTSDFGYEGLVFNTFMSVGSNEVTIDGITLGFAGLIDTSLLDSSILNNLPANMAFKYNNGGLYYLDLPAELEDFSSGSVEGSFTFYYGDSILGFKADSIRIRETVEYESYIEGAGIVELPYGDYYGIKQFVNYNRTYSVDVASVFPFIGAIWIDDVFPIPFNLNEQTHRWFGEKQKFPMIEITTDSTQQILSTRFQVKPSGSQVGIEKMVSNSNLNVFINEGFVQIKSDNIISKIELFDVAGKMIQNTVVNNKSYSLILDNKGLYFVKVTDLEGVSKTKKIQY